MLGFMLSYFFGFIIYFVVAILFGLALRTIEPEQLDGFLSVTYGALAGFVNGTLVWLGCIYPLYHGPEIFYFCWMTGMVLGTTFAVNFPEKSNIFVSSAQGAYLFTRGISILINKGFPNEQLVTNQLNFPDETENEETIIIGWPFYVYMLSMLIVTIASAVYQMREVRKEEYERE